MSINAISSVSLYVYYYQINDKNKKSHVMEELTKESVKSSDKRVDSKEAQDNEIQEANVSDKQLDYKDRPWADLIQQLGISFSANPKDDVKNIGLALDELISGIDDSELLSEVNELKDSIKSMYITYFTRDSIPKNTSNSLLRDLESISAIRKSGIL